MGAGGEVLVAAAAASALGDDQALVGLLEVVHQLAGFLVVKRGADRHLQHDRMAVLAGAVGTHAVLAALRLVLGVEAEVDERVVALRRLHDDVAAAAAVAAGGAAAGHKLLAPEGHAAVAAVAGLYADFGFIDEHGKTGTAGIRDRRSEPFWLSLWRINPLMPPFQFIGWSRCLSRDCSEVQAEARDICA